MNRIIYRQPQSGDENQISDCLRSSVDLREIADGTPAGVAVWNQICDPVELRDSILSGEKTLVAICNGLVVGFIAFRSGNHLSLLFVRREFTGQKIGKVLFTRCTKDLDEITVNSSDTAVGFYQKLGFVQSGYRFCKQGIWATPMKWFNNPTL
jgi:GNAT superfamily N-acetyltransferase